MTLKLSEITSDVTLIVKTTLATTVETDVRAGPTTLHDVIIVNNDASDRFLKFYDEVNPTAGTSKPVLMRKIAASSTYRFSVNPPTGMKFANGLSMVGSEAGGVTVSGTVSLDVTLVTKD